MKYISLASIALTVLCASSVRAGMVDWATWTDGTAGANTTAHGVISAGSSTINVTYTGDIKFIQTNGSGTNYYIPSAPYISAAVDNAPPTPDIIALSLATTHTLTFSQPVDNLFFAVVSLNGNGYLFNQDFTVESYGTGYWGAGTLTRVDMGNGTYETTGTGEPHGVIRFNDPVTSITWTSLNAEDWNGFTVGTYGVAGTVPEPTSLSLLLLGACGLLARRSRK